MFLEQVGSMKINGENPSSLKLLEAAPSAAGGRSNHPGKPRAVAPGSRSGRSEISRSLKVQTVDCRLLILFQPPPDMDFSKPFQTWRFDSSANVYMTGGLCFDVARSHATKKEAVRAEVASACGVGQKSKV